MIFPFVPDPFERFLIPDFENPVSTGLTEINFFMENIFLYFIRNIRVFLRHRI